MSDIADDSPPKPRTSNFMEFPVAPTSSVTEEYFGTLGILARRNGWAVIPQERTDRRLPGKYNGQTIKWGLYQDVAPPLELVVQWASQHFNTNVAVILGKPSGYVWALDIDVTDRKFSQAIERVAYKTLGHTTFRRLGNRPKQALFYRASGDDDLPKTKAFTFMNEEGTGPSEHVLEVQAAKRIMTLYGRHYKTLRDFTWTDYGQPGLNNVMDVPLVTKEQFEAFMAAVQELRPFQRAYRPGGDAVAVNYEYEAFEPTELVTNPTPVVFDGGEWAVTDGLVSDGREKYLAAICWALVRENAGATLTDAGIAELQAAAIAMFRSTAVMSGKWESRLAGDVHDKIGRLCDKVKSGEVKGKPKARARPAPVARISLPQKILTAVKSVVSKLSNLTTHGDREDRSTAWLSAIRRPGRLAHAVVEGEASATIPEHLQIPETAAVQREQVVKEMSGISGSFFQAAQESSQLTWLVKAPTGAGKTWSVVKAIAALKTAEPSPVLFLLPMYKNIMEQLEIARAAGLRAIMWEGKARTGLVDIDGNGCHQAAKIVKLEEAEKSAANICGVLKPGGNPSNPEDYSSLCHRRFGTDTVPPCRYWQTMAAIPSSDIVFAVHAFQTVSTPKTFEVFKTVVIDESIRGQLNRTYSLPASVLTEPRSLAYATKDEIAAGRDLQADRMEIGAIILAALKAGEDPARWIIDAPDVRDLSIKDREIAFRKEALRSAISVCSRTKDSIEITPDITDAAVEAACKVATRHHIREEEKLLRLIEERVLALVPDDTTQRLQEGGPVVVKRKVKGKTDRRIHYYRGEAGSLGKITVSWTSESNFLDRNLLLLDASADAGLLRTDLQRGEIVVKQVNAVHRLRGIFVDGASYSKTSLMPHPKDTAEWRLQKAQSLIDLRTQLTAICSMHPGGVVAGTTLAVRSLILDGWSKPDNLEVMWYGATKGLNWAQGYSASVAIGCLNPSIEQVDAMVGPYVYDQDDQEPMIDPIGEFSQDGDPAPGMTERLVDFQMRNGAVMSLSQREPQGEIARRVFDQVRREEMMQFLGRTRPILRDEIVPAYILGSFAPEGMIFDEVIRGEDLVAFGAPIELARHCDQALLTTADVIEPAEATRSEAIIAKILETPAIRRNLIEFDTVGGQRFIPAYATRAIERMLRDGEDIVYRPDMEPIIKPQGHTPQADMELRARERDIYDRLGRYAGMLGWQQVLGTRLMEHAEQYPGRQIQAAVVLQLLAWQYLPMPEEGVELYQDQLDELEAG